MLRRIRDEANNNGQVGRKHDFHRRNRRVGGQETLGASFVMISLAPLSNILTYKKRMGWNLPWFSSSESDFNVDFGVSTAEGETSGTSVFLRDEARVFRTYFTTGRGDETLGSFWTFLDLTQLGRQENWEDSPEGRPQSEPYVWWRRHDEYDQVANRVPPKSSTQ